MPEISSRSPARCARSSWSETEASRTWRRRGRRRSTRRLPGLWRARSAMTWLPQVPAIVGALRDQARPRPSTWTPSSASAWKTTAWIRRWPPVAWPKSLWRVSTATAPPSNAMGSAQQLALVKRQKIADVEKYEEESKAAKEAAVEKMRAERDQTQVERARIQAERQQVEDDAKAAREERDRQRAHAAELAEEKRRAEIRKAAAEGAIAQAAAEEMLAENRRTPILRLERWIGTALRCPNPSGCSSVLKQRFNASVTNGEHAKPAGHRDFSGSWVLFEEHDGAHLRALHQAVHDARNGVQPGQKRLFA